MQMEDVDTMDKAVAAQYEAWVYPRPIMDMAEAIATGTSSDGSDPARIRRKLWPRQVEPDDLDILVAGCGSNQAASLAMTNPGSRVVGIDLSTASLAHEQYLKQKHDLHNIELRQLTLEEAASLDQSFDLIISTGVLHHLPDPVAGLRALGDVLRPHGVISLMLYGEYPRVGVHMLQEVFRVVGLQQDADGVATVRHTLDHVTPGWHHVATYRDRDRGFDAGLVDTYLHARERAYTVADVFALVAESGLKFQGWRDYYDYAVSLRIPNPHDPLRQAIEGLPVVDQWRCVELLGQALAKHFPLVCHADRPAADYTLDFSGESWLDYVPSLRPDLQILTRQRAASHGGPSPAVSIKRFEHRVDLTPLETTLVGRIDGQRTIVEILDDEGLADSNAWQRIEGAREFFARMAEWDHLLYRIP